MVRVVYSAIQPTGRLHLGNYLGAVCHWVSLQDAFGPSDKFVVGMADLHAISSRDSSKVDSLRTARELIACGIDPSKVILKRQSKVDSILCHTLTYEWAAKGFTFAKPHHVFLS